MIKYLLYTIGIIIVLVSTTVTYTFVVSPKLYTFSDIDFGTIDQSDSIAEMELTLFNIGGGELIITDIMPDCDCTTIDYDRIVRLKALTFKSYKVTIDISNTTPGEVEKQIFIKPWYQEEPTIVNLKGVVLRK